MIGFLRERGRRPAVRGAIALTVLVGAFAGVRPAYGSVNVLVNPSLENLDPAGFPLCWQPAGWGTSTSSFAMTPNAHSGERAMQITIGAISSGDRKIMTKESPECAPAVTPGHQYDLSLWYTTTTPNTVMTLFRHDVALGWQYWTDLANLPVTSTYQQATVRTPQVPPNTDQISWGVTIYGVGTLRTDDFAMVDATVPTPDDTCSAGDACTKGVWQVMPFNNPVRSMHAVVLNNGNVLLVAGSGNDENAFKAGSFTSAVYQQKTGTFVNVPTPADLFCSGHVQLSDGRVLVMGGNKAYPVPGGAGYEGLKDSYIFDPVSNSYQRINDLIDGHWYPSATALANGDVISLGGLGPTSGGSVATEYYSRAQNRWLGINEVNQTWSFWGLYPAMVLMQDGRLFYTGSHVFGNGLPGTGASIYDYGAGTITDVPGLQNKDERDESMSVLLPPAQDQRVLTMGGGNNETNVDAHTYTDIIDLKQPSPSYVAGPLLPAGKMYVSAVILPDGKVLETGGGLHNRADPVYETSMFDPVTNTLTTGLATDPVARTYHSSAFLLPDGRVMSVGNNPGDGSFELRVSIYSPPYLFKGSRPQITSFPSTYWGYGGMEHMTSDQPIVRAALIRPAAVTHSSDPNQRFIELPLTINGNDIGMNMTNNPNIAPPGWYMLFAVNAAGVPSVARWVHVDHRT
jgi:hypothetical protein